jgi:alpha-glucosidase
MVSGDRSQKCQYPNLGSTSYNSSVSGPSGNITVNGSLSYSCDSNSFTKRGVGAGNDSDVNLNEPPYAIHNGNMTSSENVIR